MNQYQKLIAEGKIEKCIDAILEKKEEGYEKTLLLSTKWDSNEKDKMLGILDPREYTISKERITANLLQIAIDLKDC